MPTDEMLDSDVLADSVLPKCQIGAGALDRGVGRVDDGHHTQFIGSAGEVPPGGPCRRDDQVEAMFGDGLEALLVGDVVEPVHEGGLPGLEQAALLVEAYLLLGFGGTDELEGGGGDEPRPRMGGDDQAVAPRQHPLPRDDNAPGARAIGALETLAVARNDAGAPKVGSEGQRLGDIVRGIDAPPHHNLVHGDAAEEGRAVWRRDGTPTYERRDLCHESVVHGEALEVLHTHLELVPLVSGVVVRDPNLGFVPAIDRNVHRARQFQALAHPLNGDADGPALRRRVDDLRSHFPALRVARKLSEELGLEGDGAGSHGPQGSVVDDQLTLAVELKERHRFAGDLGTAESPAHQGPSPHGGQRLGFGRKIRRALLILDERFLVRDELDGRAGCADDAVDEAENDLAASNGRHVYGPIENAQTRGRRGALEAQGVLAGAGIIALGEGELDPGQLSPSRVPGNG